MIDKKMQVGTVRRHAHNPFPHIENILTAASAWKGTMIDDYWSRGTKKGSEKCVCSPLCARRMLPTGGRLAAILATCSCWGSTSSAPLLPLLLSKSSSGAPAIASNIAFTWDAFSACGNTACGTIRPLKVLQSAGSNTRSLRNA